MGERGDAATIAVAGVLIAATLAWAFWARSHIVDESTPFLVDRSPAVWIRPDRPLQLRIRELGTFRTAFRTKFYVDDIPSNTRVIVQAMKHASMRVNGLNAGQWNYPESWRRPAAIPVSWLLRPGVNTIEIVVENENGPRLLQVWSPAIGLYTDATWEARELDRPGAEWTSVVPADHFVRSELANHFDSPGQALLRILPIIVPVFILIALWTALDPQRRPPWLRRIEPSPEIFRGIVLIAWTLLAVNNMYKIPVPVGFDIEGHLNYFHFIATKDEIPLATEGWQTFQTPFYYLVASVPYEMLLERWHIPEIVQHLRIISLLCGLANVEFAFRAVRRVFPDRPDLQRLGTVAGGLMPMNLYITQFIGNEPLAAALTGFTIVIALSMLAAPRLRVRESAGIGLTWGLAILSKITAVLLGPALAFAMLYKTAHSDRRFRVFRLIPHAIVTAAIVLLICSWYFERNKRELGVYYMGGWDPARDQTWWQDPGYRVPEHMVGFGEALQQPIGAAGASMLDAFYSTMWLDGLLSSVVAYEGRPAWNDNFLLAGAWLAIVPTLLLLIGILRAFTAPTVPPTSEVPEPQGPPSTEVPEPQGAPSTEVPDTHLGPPLRGVPEGRGVFSAEASPSTQEEHEDEDEHDQTPTAPHQLNLRPPLLFAVLAVATYFAAFAALYLTLPVYGTGKATYTLGLLPAYALLITAGAAPLTRRRIPRALLYGAMAAWAVAAYAAYFVL